MTFVGESKKEESADAANKLLTPPNTAELPPLETTIATLLKRAGYATAHFGKWHVGKASPAAHGFDENDGANTNAGPVAGENPNPKQAFAITERGMDFVERQAKAGKPFYLQLSHYGGFGGTDARPETYASLRARAKSGDEKQITSAAMTEDMDAAIGMLLQKLEALHLTGRTYLLYTSDHGGKNHRDNLPLTHGKGSVWEGGIRVPLLAAGPGIPAGACARTRASTVDLFPTIASLAGIAELPKGVEGGNLAPVLSGAPAATVKRPREEFVVHFPHYDKDELGPASALLLGDDKLIRFYESGSLRLFNLAADRSERRDLAPETPEKAEALNQRLTAYLKAVGAQMPSPNPAYDPAHPAPVRKRKNEKPF